MRTREYQVVVTEQDNAVVASSVDLPCSAYGCSYQDAIEKLRARVSREILRMSERGLRPPAPRRTTLTRIALPTPSPSGHLRLARSTGEESGGSVES